jgi:NAD(P)-dependent dehydrogenase (short-subunit alcohol dehydrogenase family)
LGNVIHQNGRKENGMRLEGKTAIITGAAGEIGVTAAKLFAREGANLVLVDLTEPSKSIFENVAEKQLHFVKADVTSSSGTKRYVQEAVERFGRLDILIANAGIEGAVQPIPSYPDDIYEQVMRVNVTGVWHGLKHSIPAMQEAGGGSIVIVSSIAGLRGFPGLSAYVASKHAVIGLMRSAALEYATASIRVNTINPAPIETRMMKSIERGAFPNAPEEGKKLFCTMIPTGQYGVPQDVANLMLFLSSDESRYITGSVYSVDGGMTAI